jgi:hypothetical protein
MGVSIESSGFIFTLWLPLTQPPHTQHPRGFVARICRISPDAEQEALVGRLAGVDRAADNWSDDRETLLQRCRPTTPNL